MSSQQVEILDCLLPLSHTQDHIHDGSLQNVCWCCSLFYSNPATDTNARHRTWSSCADNCMNGISRKLRRRTHTSALDLEQLWEMLLLRCRSKSASQAIIPRSKSSSDTECFEVVFRQLYTLHLAPSYVFVARNSSIEKLTQPPLLV